MGFLWRALDRVHYLLTLARLRVVDALCDPDPETEAMRLATRIGHGCGGRFRAPI
jgi:hypothetical protein